MFNKELNYQIILFTSCTMLTIISPIVCQRCADEKLNCKTNFFDDFTVSKNTIELALNRSFINGTNDALINPSEAWYNNIYNRTGNLSVAANIFRDYILAVRSFNSEDSVQIIVWIAKFNSSSISDNICLVEIKGTDERLYNLNNEHIFLYYQANGKAYLLTLNPYLNCSLHHSFANGSMINNSINSGGIVDSNGYLYLSYVTDKSQYSLIQLNPNSTDLSNYKSLIINVQSNFTSLSTGPMFVARKSYQLNETLNMFLSGSMCTIDLSTIESYFNQIVQLSLDPITVTCQSVINIFPQTIDLKLYREVILIESESPILWRSLVIIVHQVITTEPRILIYADLRPGFEKIFPHNLGVDLRPLYLSDCLLRMYLSSDSGLTYPIFNHICSLMWSAQCLAHGPNFGCKLCIVEAKLICSPSYTKQCKKSYTSDSLFITISPKRPFLKGDTVTIKLDQPLDIKKVNDFIVDSDKKFICDSLVRLNWTHFQCTTASTHSEEYFMVQPQVKFAESCTPGVIHVNHPNIIKMNNPRVKLSPEAVIDNHNGFVILDVTELDVTYFKFVTINTSQSGVRRIVKKFCCSFYIQIKKMSLSDKLDIMLLTRGTVHKTVQLHVFAAPSIVSSSYASFQERRFDVWITGEGLEVLINPQLDIVSFNHTFQTHLSPCINVQQNSMRCPLPRISGPFKIGTYPAFIMSHSEYLDNGYSLEIIYRATPRIVNVDYNTETSMIYITMAEFSQNYPYEIRLFYQFNDESRGCMEKTEGISGDGRINCKILIPIEPRFGWVARVIVDGHRMFHDNVTFNGKLITYTTNIINHLVIVFVIFLITTICISIVVCFSYYGGEVKSEEAPLFVAQSNRSGITALQAVKSNDVTMKSAITGSYRSVTSYVSIKDNMKNFELLNIPNLKLKRPSSKSVKLKKSLSKVTEKKT